MINFLFLLNLSETTQIAAYFVFEIFGFDHKVPQLITLYMIWSHIEFVAETQLWWLIEMLPRTIT